MHHLLVGKDSGHIWVILHLVVWDPRYPLALIGHFKQFLRKVVKSGPECAGDHGWHWDPWMALLDGTGEDGTGYVATVAKVPQDNGFSWTCFLTTFGAVFSEMTEICYFSDKVPYQSNLNRPKEQKGAKVV